MTSRVELLKKIVKKEKEHSLYDERVLTIPIWRLMRHSIRTQCLRERTSFDNKTNEKPLHIKEIISSYIISLFNFFKLLFGKAKTENLIFSLPRLSKVDNVYLDKFTDPVIDQSALKDDYLILQRHQAGKHKYPRYHADHVIKSDFIDYTAKLLGLLLVPIIFLIYFNKINRLYKGASNFFSLDYLFLLKSSFAIGEFIIQYFFISILFRKLKPRRIFLVNRGIFIPAIAVAKKSDITVYEMQHGITHSETVLYSGSYDASVDPDYFLAFGEAWIGPQFGMPTGRIINIGWAYKEMVKGIRPDETYDDNYILVISEPAITDEILEVTFDLSREFSDYEFHLRLHPQEGLTKEQFEAVDNYKNVSVCDNSIDSVVAVMAYSKVIGLNSSVLYEALSMDKKVARMNMGKLKYQKLDGADLDEFEVIHNHKDFEDFLYVNDVKSNSQNLIYSDFAERKMSKILNKE